MKSFLVFAAAFLCFSNALRAQSSIKDSTVRGLLVGFSYGYQFPLGDMADRFGNNGLVGTEVTYKLRNGFTFGVEGGLIFGRSVNQAGFLDSLVTPDGYFIGYNGLYGNVALFERGYNVSATVGKVFPAFGSNPNSGIYIRLGGGLLQHKIKITDTEDFLYYLNNDYVKGYDRLTNGFMLSQYVGFLNLDPRHLLNFHVGALVQEGFTQNRRSWNFDERRQETDKRLDVLVGLRGTWLLLFYGKREQRQYSN